MICEIPKTCCCRYVDAPGRAGDLRYQASDLLCGEAPITSPDLWIAAATPYEVMTRFGKVRFHGAQTAMLPAIHEHLANGFV